uniref:Zgc:109986 n=1 Tax=Sinocyclocheilus grahami TaxID=75366 RepID=A0A672SC24_SINGR
MNLNDAKNEVLQVLSKTERRHLPKLLEWLKTSDDLDDFLVDNQSVILQSIAEDLRVCLPLEAMAPSETMAIQKTQQKPHPTVHVDAFLYDEEAVDSLCEEGKISRNYCLNCGSHRTAPLEFISHSFSIPELQFLFHNVLPGLSGKLVVDVGSRLGAVLFGVNSCFFQTCSFSLHKMFIERLELFGLLGNCDVFISCLDSHSDGTHSLQRSHW